MYFEIYRQGRGGILGEAIHGAGEWRWRFRSGNAIVASGESYKNKADCLHAIDLLKSTNQLTSVFEVTG
jgi:uncharacterized protein YegP (UPF0339 family)